MFKNIKVPENGKGAVNNDGSLSVPNNPIIPFIKATV